MLLLPSVYSQTGEGLGHLMLRESGLNDAGQQILNVFASKIKKNGQLHVAFVCFNLRGESLAI